MFGSISISKHLFKFPTGSGDIGGAGGGGPKILENALSRGRGMKLDGKNDHKS